MADEKYESYCLKCKSKQLMKDAEKNRAQERRQRCQRQMLRLRHHSNEDPPQG